MVIYNVSDITYEDDVNRLLPRNCLIRSSLISEGIEAADLIVMTCYLIQFISSFVKDKPGRLDQEAEKKLRLCLLREMRSCNA